MFKRFTQVKNIKEKIIFLVSYIVTLGIFVLLNQSCVFVRLFGIVCPGCGMTRAYKALLSFDIIGAFEHHLMFWSVPIMLIYFWFDGHIFKRKNVDRIIFWIIVTGFAINWIINLLEYVNF